MVRRLSVVSASVLLALVCGCADREKSSTADARVMFTGEHDFQRVAVHASREIKVSLQNVGRTPLNVLDIWVEDADGSYKAYFDHEGPHSMIPGGDCTAVIRFNPKTPGHKPGSFVIHTDSREEPYFRVEIKGIGLDARARIEERKVDFGRLELGTDKTKKLTIENPSELPVIVNPHMIGADADEFAFEGFTMAPFEKRTVDLTFTPTRVGVKQATLAITPCEGCVDHIVTLVAEGLDKAIIPVPADLDFGPTPMDRDTKLSVKLRNISTEPQDVTGFAFSGSTDPSFTQVSGQNTITLQGGEETTYVFRYSPGHMGEALGEAGWTLSSKRNPTLTVPMAGFGGAPEVCVSPMDHTFKEKPVGAKVSVGITVRNCGTSNAPPLTITELVPGPSSKGIGGAEQFAVNDVKLPVTLAAGEEMTFRVIYEPMVAGEHGVTVGIRTNGFQASVAKVDVQGSARDHLPCNIALTPGAIDFGTVVPGGEGVLGLKVNNIGTDVCPVKNIEIVDDGGNAFHMPGGKIPGVIVEAGYYFSFMVQFTPPSGGGTFVGSLKVEMSDPANPVVYIPLTGHSQTSCIVAKPHWLDFGVTRPGCAPDTLKTSIENVCTADVDVTNVEIGMGTTDGEFELAGTPSLPVTLKPGESVDVSVRYFGDTSGMNLSPLFVTATGLAQPYLVPLIGESSQSGEKKDTFVQQDGGKVDVLFVIDNTASMIEEHPKLVSAIPDFINAAQAKNVDLHIAVTTTGLETASSACPGGAMGGEAGRFFPVDNSRPRMMTLNTPNVTSILQQNVQVGQCAYIEQGFEALKYALTDPLVNHTDDPRTSASNDGNKGFLRDSAALAVIFVGDEDDHSPDDVSDYVSWLRGLKGRSQPQRSVIYAIAPNGQSCGTAGGTGTRYAEAAAKTGGEVMSICSSDYGPILAKVAGKAFSPQKTFALSSEPEAGSLRVFVDGVEMTNGWTFDWSKNQVVFDTEPPAGAEIEAEYSKACES